MIVRRQHGTTRAEALARADRFAEELLRVRLPDGVALVEATREWQGDLMLFAVKGRKGLFSATVEGAVEVTAEEVIVDCSLPGMLQSVVPEAKLRDAIEQGLDRVFPAAGRS